MKPRKFLTLTCASLVISLAAGALSAKAAPPNPVLTFTGTEYYTVGGKHWVRHHYDVFNKDQFPADLFAAAPNLPPCGANTNSSRTWIDFFDSRGKRLHGFCALLSPDNLGSIWFPSEVGEAPPFSVYIEIHDRQNNAKYKSNLAATMR